MGRGGLTKFQFESLEHSLFANLIELGQVELSCFVVCFFWVGKEGVGLFVCLVIIGCGGIGMFAHLGV